MGFGVTTHCQLCQARASPDARAALMNSVRAGDFIAASEEEVGVEFWGVSGFFGVDPTRTRHQDDMFIYVL